MPKQTLTSSNLRTLEAINGRRTDYRDDGKGSQQGLLLRVSGPKDEDRVFYFEYSFRGVSRRYRLGALNEPAASTVELDERPPDGWTRFASLAERRGEVSVLRGLVNGGKGVDVFLAREERLNKKSKGSAGETFGDLADRCLKDIESELRPATFDEYRRLLKKDLAPMRNVPATDAGAVKQAALETTDAIAKRSGYVANRCLELARRVMSWAVSKDRAIPPLYAANPLLRVARPLREEAIRTRVYTATELRKIVPACAGTPLEDLVSLLLATGARAGETMAAEWSEIDEESKTWTIPAAKSKIDHDRPVHLSKVALEVLGRVKEKSEETFLFPSRSATGHQERRQKLIYEIRERSGIDDFELHDLRRVVRSGLADLGTPNELAELCLGHLPPKLVRRYAPHPAFWQLSRQREVVEVWGAKLERLLSGEQKGANVLAFAQ